MAASQYPDGATEIVPKNRLSASQTDAQRLTELTEQSRKDLASRLKVKPATITVIEARHVVWPDSSAGCPKPGYFYTQMLTPGVLIRLKVNDRTYQYHSGRRGAAVYCEKPTPLAGKRGQVLPFAFLGLSR